MKLGRTSISSYMKRARSKGVQIFAAVRLDWVNEYSYGALGAFIGRSPAASFFAVLETSV
jgi:hypothetical protein